MARPRRKAASPKPLPAGLPPETAHFVSPQLARVVPSVPTGDRWVHELKFDGYRLIIARRASEVTAYTRSGLDWTDKFRTLAEHAAMLPGGDFVIDGEAVVFDEKGRSGFGLLQAALTERRGSEIVFVAFDILHLAGASLRDLPLTERLEWLKEVVPEEIGPIRRSRVWPAADGKALFDQAALHGLEGIISKPAGARYVEGSRKEWTKSKSRPRQEFIVCGFTPPKSSLRLSPRWCWGPSKAEN